MTDTIGNGTTGTAEIKMVVGLGNPGPEYARHRHNIGFQCVDLFAQAHGLHFDQRQGKASLAIGRCGAQRLILVKPMTFMNTVGPAVAAVAHFYRVLPAEMLVIYDDLDLPLGRVRVRPEGGSGGHNGMKSLIQQIGTQSFPRLRVGIGRPPGRMDPADYVLQNFSTEQEERMAQVREQAVKAVECWLDAGVTEAMNIFNMSAPNAVEP